jgi:hypothetical protein
MRLLVIPALLAFNLISLPALAENRSLFLLRKPVNPENLVQVFVPVSADFKIGHPDFIWLMNGRRPKVPNGILRCNILKRLRPAAADPKNKAACPKKLPPGVSCYQEFITADEVSRVRQNVPLVIRSVKSASTHQCSVAAFMDLGSKVVQVKQINTNGQVFKQGLRGATVQFSSVQVIGIDGSVAANWKCRSNCVEQIHVDWFCTR